MPNTISAAELLDKLKNNEPCCIVDIRTEAEYTKSRLKAPTIHIPLDRLDASHLRKLSGDSGRPIYFLCRSDTRARYAAEKFKKEDLDNIIVIDGGMNALKALNAEIEKGVTSPCDIFARLAGVSLAVLALGLGYMIHPGFYVLAAAITFGLVMSLVRGKCPMGQLLKKIFTGKASCCGPCGTGTCG